MAERILNMLKQRVIGDYMQTSAILDKDFRVLSAVNTPNTYAGPGTRSEEHTSELQSR